jgi:hypothetical protein
LSKPRLLEVVCEDTEGNSIKGVAIDLFQSGRSVAKAASDGSGRAILSMKAGEEGILYLSHDDYLLGSSAVRQVGRTDSIRHFVFSRLRLIRLKLTPPSTVKPPTRRVFIAYRSLSPPDVWKAVSWWEGQSRGVRLPDEPVVLLITVQGFKTREMTLRPREISQDVDVLEVDLDLGTNVIIQARLPVNANARHCALTITPDEIFGLRGTTHEKSKYAARMLTLQLDLNQHHSERLRLSPGRYDLSFKSDQRTWSQELVVEPDGATESVWWE